MKNKLKNLLNTILFSVLVLLITSCVQSSNYYPSNDNNTPNNKPDAIYNDPNFSRTDIPEVPNEKKAVDILVLMYMDGDNSLHNDIWGDLVEVVSGYNYLSNSDNIEVIILWDGYKGYKPHYYASNEWNYASKLFKVAKDNTLIDISKNISWLHNDPSDSNKTEVSMNDIATLTNFLDWANKNYTSNMKILQLSDHGAGPAELTMCKRAICEDQDAVTDKASNKLLGTKDVPQAIRNSGIGKFDLVIQDVCLGSTIEEAYEYIGVADYMLLSPNLTPGEGHNYINLISQLSKNENYEEGKLNIKKYVSNIIEGFINYYKQPMLHWNSFKEEWIKKNGVTSMTDYELSLAPNTINPIDYKDFGTINNTYPMNYSDISTLTSINVNEIESLKIAIDEMIDLIESNPNKRVAASVVGIPLPISYYKAINTIFSTLDGYAATTGHIYDIGFLTDKIKEIASYNDWNELVVICDKIKTCLNNVIFASWRDGVGGALYYKSSISNPNIKPILSSGTYGLAIAGYDYINNTVNSSYYSNDYKTSLAYAKNSKWVSFINHVR